MSDTSAIDLRETSEIAKYKIGKTITVGNTDYIYLKNRSSATELGAVFAYDPITYTFENLASNANLTGKVRPLAVFNADRNASNFVASTKDIRNMQLYSQAFDNAAYTKVSCSISADSTTAPDATTTADTITATAASSTHYLYDSAGVGLASGEKERHSIYAKKGTHPYVSLSNAYGDALIYNFDTGLYKTAYLAAGFTFYNVESLSNGWVRLTIEFTKTDSSTRQIYFSLRSSYSSSATGVGSSWTPAGTETVYVWGAQKNNASDATDYAATTTTHYHDVPSAIAVPASYYAWAAIRGELQITALGSCVKDVPLYTSATAGYLDDSSSSQTLIPGVFLEKTNGSTAYTRLIQAYAVNQMRS